MPARIRQIKKKCYPKIIKIKCLEEMKSAFQLLLILAILSLGAGLLALVVAAAKLLLALFFLAVIYRSVFR